MLTHLPRAAAECCRTLGVFRDGAANSVKPVLSFNDGAVKSKHRSHQFIKNNSLNQLMLDLMTYLADSVMEISVPSILSACSTFSMMGLLT